MRKYFFKLSVLFFIIISSFSLFLKNDYFYGNKNNINDDVVFSESALNRSTKAAKVNVSKYVINTNTIQLWVYTTVKYNDGFLNLKIFDSENASFLDIGNIWYIPYDETIYGEGYDPSNYDTWTSDPVPSYGPNFNQRWYFEIPGFIDNVGGSSSNWDDYDNRRSVPFESHLEPNSDYSILFKTKNGVAESRYNFKKRSNVVFNYSNNFGQVSEIYRNPDDGKQVVRINTQIDGNSWDVDNSYFDIVFSIINPDGSILTTFNYNDLENHNYYDFYSPTILTTGYYEGYKLKIDYNNGNYQTSNLDTLEQSPERESVEFIINDEYNESGFVVVQDLYIDFSNENKPTLDFIDYQKARISFNLVNKTEQNLDNKVFISDRNGVKFDNTKLLSSNYDGSYNGKLTYEIYDLDYNTDYEFYVLIESPFPEFNFSYKKNLFLNENIRTLDKYPNLMIVNYVFILIFIIFLILSIYYFVIAFKSV